MNVTNKILVPYDFSPTASYALDFASQLVRKESGEILLLNVIEPPTPDSFHTMGVQPAGIEDEVFIKRLYEVVQDRLSGISLEDKFKDVTINHKVKIGKPYQHIIEEIVNEKASIVVMGTEGSEGLGELFIGSNAERVVRNATCPVITINTKSDLEKIENIVFPCNVEMITPNLIEHVKKLQNILNAKLRIVKINTPASFTCTRDDIRDINSFINTYKIENYTTDIYNDMSIGEGILSFVKDIKAEMIIIGTHQRRGLSHLFLGSITERTVNHAQIPVYSFGFFHK